MTVPLDFDKWMRMAEEEPKRFEVLRQQMIEQQISASSASNQSRLRGLQFQIDAKRRTSGSAMGACVEISSMMFDHLYNDLVTAINALLNGDPDALKTSPVKNTKVIPFHKKIK